MEAKLKVKYEAGHSYDETWVPTDYHCPRCAAKDVWVEQSEGDYYQGPSHLCRKCGASFALPSGAYVNDKNWQNQQRLKVLRDCPNKPDEERPAGRNS